jgi:hypothetical protein
MNNSNVALTPAQEIEARCGDWGNDWLFLAAVCGVGTVLMGVAWFWAWRHRPDKKPGRGFEVI